MRGQWGEGGETHRSFPWMLDADLPGLCGAPLGRQPTWPPPTWPSEWCLLVTESWTQPSVVPTWQAPTPTLAPMAAGKAPARGLLPACSAPPPPGARTPPCSVLTPSPPRGRPLCSPRPWLPVWLQREPLPSCSFRTPCSVLTPAGCRRGAPVTPMPHTPPVAAVDPLPWRACSLLLRGL